jgi:gliding motility-associated-like protein
MKSPVHIGLYRLIAGILLIISPLHLFSQLSVSQQNAQALVQNVLVGSGVTVSNISFTGDPRMLGSFNGSNSNIGLQSGIIMSTGRIFDAIGPNNSASIGEDLNRTGYAPLQNLLGPDAKTQDAAILRFNFFCEGDKVQFKYVFASEEYPEYVGTKYNDVFAFFIQGPGINGMQNIARIPGSNNTPVAINNVNQSSYAAYFVNNGNGITGGGSTVQFDGFTRPFFAEATVVPCEEYTIIMAIADVSDGLYDSGVFLEAQSFTSPEVNIRQQISYVGANQSLYEDCGNNRIILTRTGQTDKSLTVFLETGGSATYGTDYTAFPKTIVFPAGQDSVSFLINAFSDNQNEAGGETVSIIYRDTGCTEIKIKRVDFTIFDAPGPLQVSAGNDINLICPREPVSLQANVTGGVGPYTLIWENNPAGNPITVNPDSSSHYKVVVTDQCGSRATDSLWVNIVNYTPLKFNIPLEATICAGGSVLIGGVASGGKMPLRYQWLHTNSTDPFQQVSPVQDNNYIITVTDSCNISITRTIKVRVRQVNALFDLTYTDQNTIQFSDLSRPKIARWEWDFGDQSSGSEDQNPLHTYLDTGRYVVTLVVIDENNCTDTVRNPVRSFPDFSFYVPNAFTPDGDGINDQFSGIGEGFLTYEMLIFNRWGEVIFKTSNYDERWGLGKRGVLDRIPIDTYVYKITLVTPTLDRKQYVGRVSVIR